MKKTDLGTWAGHHVVQYVTHELRQHATVASGYAEMLLKKDSSHIAPEQDRDWLRHLDQEIWTIRALVDFCDTWGQHAMLPEEPLDDVKVQTLREHVDAYLRIHQSDRNKKKHTSKVRGSE